VEKHANVDAGRNRPGTTQGSAPGGRRCLVSSIGLQVGGWRRTRRPDLRVLFMSGYTVDELEAQGLGGATTRLLVKPFSLDELGARLRQALAGPAGL